MNRSLRAAAVRSLAGPDANVIGGRTRHGDGSFIAAIIHIPRTTKTANDPSAVATPMSMPSIRRTTPEAAASPSVAATTAAVAAGRALVVADRAGFRLAPRSERSARGGAGQLPIWEVC